jgi:hypothetical protein
VTDIFDQPEDDQLVYELGEWSLDQRAALGEALANRSIPHTYDGIDLVIHEDWEVEVDSICDAIEKGDPVVDDDVDDEPSEVMGNLFEAADRLLHDTRDVDASASLIALADNLDPEEPPFGVDPAVWERVVDTADDLADGIAEEDDEIINSSAGQLRGLLRPLV